ncbi:MAG: quinone oxidoreductase [Candidatus Lustribacter sp.]
MKIIRVERIGGPEVLQTAESDVPAPAAGEVLIRQTAIGINYIDVYLRTGAYPHALPFVPGREGVGTVEAVGSDVAGIAPGMRVGYPDSPNLGSYAEYVTVPARFCVEVPEGIGDQAACGAMLQALTAQYLASDSYAIDSGDRVLIHAAAGGVGRILVQLAKRRGAVVIATAGGPAKTALAKSAGADHVIDYRAVDFEPEVKRITGGAGVDAVYDSVGKDTWERSLKSLRVRGSFVLYGASSGKVPPIDPQTLSAAGSVFFSRPTFAHFARTHGELTERATEVFDAILDGSLEIRVSNTYPLAEAAQAHRDLEARNTSGKALLLP